MPANPRTRATVDIDQKDPSKAVDRGDAEDRALPASEDAEMSDSEKKHVGWLDKDRAVKARIGRFQRNLTRQFDQERANTQAELQRMRRENEDLRKSLTVSRTDPSADDATHEREMSALQSQLDAAHERGDSKEVGRITRDIARKEAAFMNAKTAAQLGQANARRDEERSTENDSPTQQQARKPTSEGRKFVQANQDWWDDPDCLAERSFANALHARMVDEDGSDPGTDEHYVALATELKKKFPKLDIQGVKLGKTSDADDEDFEEPDAEEPVQKPARRAPIQNFRDRGDPGSQRRRNGVALTEADFATMRAVGLDPNNDKHIVQFGKAKKETADAMRSH